MANPDKPSKPWTVTELLQWATQDFKKRGIDTPRLDAEILLASALSCTRVDLYLKFNQVPEKYVLDAFREAVLRRRNREPVAHIVGGKSFHDVELRVEPGLFVPRPETELLVDEAVERLSRLKTDKIKILDVGAGTGAIALAVLKAVPRAKVWAVDVNPRAVEVITGNAERLGLASRVIAYQGDMFTLDRELPVFDLAACNPPYVPTGEIGNLMPEVRDHEPKDALDGGPDGLNFIRQLISKLPSQIKPGGWLILEVGEGQAEEVESMDGELLVHEATRKDLRGIPRIVIFRRI